MTIYLDHNATTPLRPEVWEAMASVEFGTELRGNPSSVHRVGVATMRQMGAARHTVALILCALDKEIVFTGGGSEAINLALQGAVHACGRPNPHLISTTVEHHAVLHALDALAAQGCSVTLCPVEVTGRVDPRAIADVITPDTLLVSVMFVNNEVGTIQPIAEIGALCRERGVLLHVDAVQAVGKLPVNVDDLQCDLLSFSAHKFNGPQGVGGLYVRTGTPLLPLVHGGPQEWKLRAGTQ
ncbi:MAG: cysteine desulfurase family protein, partial [Armatimonadota bacterium]